MLFRIIQSIHPKISTGSAFGRKSSQPQPTIPTKGTQGTLESNDQSAEENINEQAHPIQNSIMKNDTFEKQTLTPPLEQQKMPTYRQRMHNAN